MQYDKNPSTDYIANSNNNNEESATDYRIGSSRQQNTFRRNSEIDDIQSISLNNFKNL